MEAVRAMGGLIDLAPATYLVNLLGAPNQSLSIQQTAADALAEMTGLSAYGNNARLWHAWLASANGKNATQFHAMLLESRGNEAVRLKQLQDAVGILMKDYYYNTPSEAKKVELVLEYLKLPLPSVAICRLGSGG